MGGWRAGCSGFTVLSVGSLGCAEPPRRLPWARPACSIIRINPFH